MTDKIVPIVGLDPEIVDMVKLVVNILGSGGEVAEGVSLKADREINVKLTSIQDGFKVDFLAPEPVATITKFIKISDKIDYIKMWTNGKLAIKVRGWAFEIPVTL